MHDFVSVYTRLRRPGLVRNNINCDNRVVTIDERLEALTHSVELLAQMQIKTERDLKRVGKYIGAIGQMVLNMKRVYVRSRATANRRRPANE